MRTYLIFTLRGSRYAIDVVAVAEIVPLPALSPVAEAPPYLAGLLNLRGRILPVIDLAARLGLPPHPPRVTDIVIVVRLEEEAFGLIVDRVEESLDLPDEWVGPVPSYGVEREHQARFITAMARVGQTIVAVLGLDRVIHLSDGLAAMAPAEEPALSFGADEGEREIFLERARGLVASPQGRMEEGRAPVALFSLGGEHFGIRLDPIREFAEIHEVTPIPCTPAHIVGQTNLRGDILTLVDIRGALSLPVTHSGEMRGKAIVIQIGDIRAGIIADDVLDIVDLLPEDIAPVPAALHARGEAYITGIIRRGERIFSMLDVERIFTGGELDVDEQVG